MPATGKLSTLWCCRRVGHKFERSYNALTQAKGCPVCDFSKSQCAFFRRIQQLLPGEGIFQEVGKRTLPWLGRQRFDVYIPGQRLAIEYHGELHYGACDYFGGESTLRKIQRRDQEKRVKCRDQEVVLIEISSVDEKALSDAELLKRLASKEPTHPVDRDVQHEPIRFSRKKFATFAEAREYSRALGLTNRKGWRSHRLKPDHIPANPDRLYAASWNGWADFLNAPIRVRATASMCL